MVIIHTVTVIMTIVMIIIMMIIVIIFMMLIIMNSHQWQGFQRYQDSRDGHIYKFYMIVKRSAIGPCLSMDTF